MPFQIIPVPKRLPTSRLVFTDYGWMTGNLEIEWPRRLAGPDYFLLADSSEMVRNSW